ncbi:MAG: hypothetical protein ACOC83_07180, partial [Gemmatimonadota bacterium]
STLGKFAMYPDGHPTLEPAVDELAERLGEVIARRGGIAIEIRRRRLVVGDGATDPENPLLAGLAGRLHQHQLRVLGLAEGVTRDEIRGLLSALAQDPARAGGDPLGLADEDGRWEHVRIVGRRYDPLRLDSGVSGEPSPAETEPDGAPVGSRLAGADLLERRPSEVARAVEDRLEEEDLDRVVAFQLLRMTERLGEASGEEAEAIRERLSRVVLSLPSDVLGMLLGLLEGDRGDEELLLAAARSMEVEATLKLVQAAASRRDGREVIAEWLLELVLKLSMYGRRDDDGSKRRTREVDELVERILDAWDLDDPRPPVYQTALHRMARNPPRDAGLSERRARSIFISPERVLKMGLELDEPADYVRDAAEQMLAAERFGALAEMLERVPDDHGLARRLWNRMSERETVVRILESDPPGFPLLEQLLDVAGVELAPPLLDALSSQRSESRVYWRKVFNLLLEIGEPVIELVPRRLDDDRWYVRRNMLALLRELPGRPESFSALPLLDDEDARVRAEALSLALEDAEERDPALVAGLRDGDTRMVGLALSAAESDCPEAAVPPLAEMAGDPDQASSHRLRAVRLLAHADGPEALRALQDLVWQRKWLFWREIAPGSPLVVQALEAMRDGWSDEPAVRRALEAAAGSDDERVREAAGAGEEGEP